MIGRDDERIWSDDKYFVEISNHRIQEIKENYMLGGVLIGISAALIMVLGVNYFI